MSGYISNMCDAVSLVGSLVATTQVLVLPALLVLAYDDLDAIPTSYRRVLAYTSILVGLVVGCTGTVIFVVQLASQFSS